jgi:hypothetical protein
MAASAPDLVLENATLYVPSGQVSSATGSMVLQSSLVAAPQNGVPIQIFPARSLTITGTLAIRGAQPEDVPAVAFVVRGEVRVNGSILLLGTSAEDASVTPPPGSITLGPCVGSVGTYDAAGQPIWGAGAAAAVARPKATPEAATGGGPAAPAERPSPIQTWCHFAAAAAAEAPRDSLPRTAAARQMASLGS